MAKARPLNPGSTNHICLEAGQRLQQKITEVELIKADRSGAEHCGSHIILQPRESKGESKTEIQNKMEQEKRSKVQWRNNRNYNLKKQDGGDILEIQQASGSDVFWRSLAAD